MAFYRRSKAVAMANISASRQGTKAVAKKYLGETASVLHVLGGRRRPRFRRGVPAETTRRCRLDRAGLCPFVGERRVHSRVFPFLFL